MASAEIWHASGPAAPGRDDPPVPRPPSPSPSPPPPTAIGNGRTILSRRLRDWNLRPDGPAVVTDSSILRPVRRNGAPAMLKIPIIDEERAGGALLSWWGGLDHPGAGAAPVLAHDAEAVLLARASAPDRLATMARNGRDEEATRILCAVASALHAPRPSPPPPGLIPLQTWFDDLHRLAPERGGILVPALRAARELLSTSRETVPLHGDLHHGNVLEFRPGVWGAIDPKALRGERGFEYANIFRNPDAATALHPGRFELRLAIVCRASGLDRRRLLLWVLAVMGLAMAWHEPGRERSGTDGTARAAALALAALER